MNTEVKPKVIPVSLIAEWAVNMRANKPWGNNADDYAAKMIEKVIKDLERRIQGRKCVATISSEQDCGWPLCGCDPASNEAYQLGLKAGVDGIPDFEAWWILSGWNKNCPPDDITSGISCHQVAKEAYEAGLRCKRP